MGADPSKPRKPQFSLLRGGARRGGARWTSIIADFRRAKLSSIAGGDANSKIIVPSRAILQNFDAEAIMTFFHASESLRKFGELRVEGAPKLYIQALLAIAGAPAGRRSQLLEKWTLEEPAEIGILPIEISLGPEGFLLVIDPLQQKDLSGLGGLPVHLQFEGARRLTETLQNGAARFGAGAALLESRALESLAVEFPGFGLLSLQPG